MSTCIYCRRSDPALVFNREHVMCRAFGTFKENLVLDGVVCQECNQAMGDEVEGPGTRGSLEGLHRFKTKLMTAESFLKIPRRRVTYEMGAPGWEGVKAYRVPTDDGDGVKVMFHPQVVVDFGNGRHRSFLLEEITRAGDFSGAVAFRVYTDGLEEQTAVIAALERIGIQPKWQGAIEASPVVDGQTLVKFSAVYDDVVRRLVAKIAFNYLAYVTGAHFVLKPEFDPIRNFIRHGQGRGADFVTPTKTPLLFNEQNSGRWAMTSAHLVAIDRNGADETQGHVSLFNLVHNVIRLSVGRPEIIHLPEIPSGRQFLWKTGDIVPLRGVAGDNLVQPADVFARGRK